MAASAICSWHNFPTRRASRRSIDRLEEAIRAFQTALILEPTNRQAKTSLGSSYCDELIGQFDSGRGLLREVIEENFNDSLGQTVPMFRPRTLQLESRPTKHQNNPG